MELTGSQIVIECLKEQGVDTVFGYPGGTILNIYDELYRHPEIHHILTSHEQGAAHAADGYARATGKTGVCMATSGPGATNLVTGIATAYMDSTPMVAITCNVGKALLGKDSFQEIDIAGVAMPITKYSVIVKDITVLADTLRRAFSIAKSGRPGPVLVDITKDVTAATYEYEPKTPEAIAPSTEKITEEGLDHVVSLIRKSKKPYIFVGGGSIISGAAEEVRELAHHIQAPVCDTLMGKGAFSGTDQLYTGMLGMHGTKTAAEAIKNCDLFIGIGTRFSDRVIGNPQTFAPDAKVLHIDIDPAEINKNIKVYHQVIGDSTDVMKKLIKLIPQQSHSGWMGKIKTWEKQYECRQKGTDELTLTPQHLIETLDKLTGGEALIATEVGQSQMWAAQYYAYKHPHQLITSGGLGTMGYGLGAAIGAKCGNPDKTVVNIAGDGSFHMNLNELVTLSKHNIPVVELVINNNVLGMVRQWQRLFYGKRFSQTTLDRPTDYMKLGEAFGIKSFVIDSEDKCEEILREALEVSKTAPVLIEARIDKDINVLPMVPAGKSITEPILEIEIDD